MPKAGAAAHRARTRHALRRLHALNHTWLRSETVCGRAQQPLLPLLRPRRRALRLRGRWKPLPGGQWAGGPRGEGSEPPGRARSAQHQSRPLCSRGQRPSPSPPTVARRALLCRSLLGGRAAAQSLVGAAHGRLWVPRTRAAASARPSSPGSGQKTARCASTSLGEASSRRQQAWATATVSGSSMRRCLRVAAPPLPHPRPLGGARPPPLPGHPAMQLTVRARTCLLGPGRCRAHLAHCTRSPARCRQQTARWPSVRRFWTRAGGQAQERCSAVLAVPCARSWRVCYSASPHTVHTAPAPVCPCPAPQAARRGAWNPARPGVLCRAA